MNEKNTNKKFSIFDNIIAYFIYAILILLVGSILGSFIIGIPTSIYYAIVSVGSDLDFMTLLTSSNNNMSPVAYTAIMYLSPIGIWVAVLLAFLIKKNRPMFKCFTTAVKGNNVPKFLLGFLLGFGMNGICILIAWINGDISLKYDSINILGLIIILLCVFIQSSSEEMLCRGYLYQKFMNRKNIAWLAIILNSLFFSFLHIFNNGVTILSLVNITLAGLVTSLMVFCLDSMWCAMAFHTTWNYTQNIIFGLPNSGTVVPFSIFKLDNATARDSFAYNIGFGIEGTIIAMLVQIIFCIIVLIYYFKKKPETTNIWSAE